MEIRSTDNIASIPREQWNQLSDGEVPFLQHEFLQALEDCDCLQPNGWQPLHLTLTADDGQLLGALPLYVKSNSLGEFVFDWSWADAYERAGGKYYPKLVCAIPFTPVTGARLLVAPEVSDPASVQASLVQGAVQVAEQLEMSSLHLLFPPPQEAHCMEEQGLMTRIGCQYHWHNKDYADFDAFLATLNSKRRKMIKRERRKVAEANVEIEILRGDQIDKNTWRTYYEFYCSTFHRRWGEPRLSLEFFESLTTIMPEQTLLFLAKHDGDYVAGAFTLKGKNALFGRHWGCSERFKFLHFELCYYQTIQYCIEHGLARLDAGAQGEHKLMRGFEPVRTWSAHWIRDAGFRNAVGDFLERETDMINSHIVGLAAHSPYRREE